MLAISLWQPWASLLVHGKKRVETRSYPVPKSTEFPVVLAVHAAKQWNNGQRHTAFGEPFRSALRDLGYGGGKSLGLPLGFVIGLVRVAGYYTTDWLVKGRPEVSLPGHGQLSTDELAFGDYSPGRYGWVCDEFRVLDRPVACRGHQKFFDWQPTAEAVDMAAELTGG